MKSGNRLVPIWLLPLVLLMCFSITQCGCRTGGKWVSSGSTGAKQIIIPSELQQQPDGTYRIKPKETQPTKVKSTPVETKSAITRPELPEPKNATPENLPPAKIKPAGSPTSFKPTITNIEPEKRMNVKPIKKNPPANTTTEDRGDVKSEGEVKENVNQAGKGDEIKVNWLELFMFYFLAGMAIVFVWLLYDLWREYRKAQTPEKTKTKKKRAPRKASKKTTKQTKKRSS